MRNLLRCLVALAAIGMLDTSAVRASQSLPPLTPAQLIVEDGARFFTPAKIEEARGIIGQSMGTGSRQVHVETFKSLAAAEQTALNAAADKKKFWHDWAVSKTRGDRGISIFIVRDPPRYEVQVDREMQALGFDDAKKAELKKLIRQHLELVAKAETPAAKQTEMDATLLGAANYLQTSLPSTTRTGGKSADAKRDTAKNDQQKEGSKIGTYLCIGALVLLGIWLVVGLIRAFSGGGTGGAGGGGFGTALLGGLFGAMAGMWLYNSFFGGSHDSSAFGGDGSSGGDGGNEAGGAGDYGGDWGGDAGGGDWGGGGDW